MFLTEHKLSTRTDLTWSTAAIAREFIEIQEAVLAVVTRAGERETEFLLVENENYGVLFFPTQRVKSEVKPQAVALSTVRSEGGIALIERTQEGKRQWLAQWNESWKAFFFVGGHREGTETFRECVVREIEEELQLGPVDCRVAPAVFHHLKYRAISRSAGTLTDYTMELFQAQPSAAALDKIERNPHNKWLDTEEIARLETHDGRPVSVGMGLLLTLAKRL